MDSYELRLVEDELAAGTIAAIPALEGFRVTYIAAGSATLGLDGGGEEFREQNSAVFAAVAATATAGGDGATLWRWEMVRDPGDTWEAGGDVVHSVCKASHPLNIDESEEHMMRCDRVDFPLDGIAYTHIHSGPGLRCLLRGELMVRVDDGEESIVRPGETWYERGPDPIYAQASGTKLTSFVRAMVVPRAFKGRTTITYVKPEDTDKPKPQEYTRFVDQFIDP